MEQIFNRLSQLVPVGQTKHGFLGGIIIGLSLGLLWTPCVGPILASVISLAITGTVTLQAFVITLSYSLGTSIPMFIIMIGGQRLLKSAPWLLSNSARIQKAFGVVMIITAIGIFFNLDRKFQTFILDTFPNYGVGLTKFEDNKNVKQELKKINEKPMDEEKIGKPMSELTLPNGPIAPEIISGGVWFNSKPLKLSELRGKVVIIDFWTYSCINCQRTLPYLRSWWEKYRDKGLVIIGVHSPEFEFEKNENNVAEAISDFKLIYPVVQDNDFATWQAYNNRYWPAKYFIDKDGIVRFSHFGEGAYDESEEVIRRLLAETGSAVPAGSVSNPQYQVYSKTPETYLGYQRLQNFASPETINKDSSGVYTSPQNLPNDYFAYEGAWNIMPEYASPVKGSKLHLNFESKEVFLVARSKNKTSSFKVYLDGELKYFGEDNINGIVNVDSDRLYKLIKLPAPGRHNLRIEFQDGNTEVYAFTFG